MFLRPRRGPRRLGRVVEVPAGRAVVATDLHGHVRDFETLLARSRCLERIAAGEELVLVVAGDIPDVARHRVIDEEVDERGDLLLFDRLLELRLALGEQGDRIVYLEGNHDYHLLRLLAEMTQAVAALGLPLSRDAERVVDDAAYNAFAEEFITRHGQGIFENNVRPYDMIQRLAPRHLPLLRRAPLVARLGREAGGALVLHGGPSRRGHGRGGWWLRRRIRTLSRQRQRQLVGRAYYESPYHELLNGRYRLGDYAIEDISAFCDAFGCGLMLSGHTPTAYFLDPYSGHPLEGCELRDGLVTIGRHQAIFCTSFGASARSEKVYVELDLARAYASTDDLRPGEEVHRLYPEPGSKP
jgi:hypothetical protein